MRGVGCNEIAGSAGVGAATALRTGTPTVVAAPVGEERLGQFLDSSDVVGVLGRSSPVPRTVMYMNCASDQKIRDLVIGHSQIRPDFLAVNSWAVLSSRGERTLANGPGRRYDPS